MAIFFFNLHAHAHTIAAEKTHPYTNFCEYPLPLFFQDHIEGITLNLIMCHSYTLSNAHFCFATNKSYFAPYLCSSIHFMCQRKESGPSHLIIVGSLSHHVGDRMELWVLGLSPAKTLLLWACEWAKKGTILCKRRHCFMYLFLFQRSHEIIINFIFSYSISDK